LSFGTAQKDIIPTLRKLGDVASGVGASIEDLVIPFGRLQSTQKLTLVELDKFADRGAVTYQQLADKAGVSIKTIRDDISKGRIPFEVFSSVLEDSTKEGGKFFNAMVAQSKTLDGATSNLGDAFTSLSSTFGKVFRPFVVRGLGLLSKGFDDIRKNIKNLNLFDAVLIPLTKFNDAVIDNVIRPFEIVFNVASKVGNFVGKAFADIANSLLAFFQPVINLANKALSALGRGIINVGKDIKQTFVESNTDGFFNGVLEDTSLAAGLATKNEAKRAYLLNQRQIFKAEDDALGAQADEGIIAQTEKLTTAFQSQADIYGGIAQGFMASTYAMASGLKAQLQQVDSVVGKFSKNTGLALRKGIGQSAGQAFGEFGKALQSGENAFEAFGKSFLKSIGQTLIQQGTAFILEGTGYLFSANPALQALGPGLIGAGSAMAVFGGVLGASVGGGGANGGGGGATSAGSTDFGSDTIDEGFVGEIGASSEPQTVLNINVEGNVVDQEAFTRRLVDQIGDEGGKQGLVFNNFSQV